MPTPSPLPAAIPFSRLTISDGLLMTAELWNQAHEYHRQRQHFYYQALFQPGIVWGLGVGVSAAPEAVEGRYRDGRWLQVQPGVAIDRLGNPLVVPEAIHFRMQSDPPQGETATVFLVLRYSDPRDRVGNGSAAAGVETFALVETTDPQPEDVELCRLVMTAGQPDLSGPRDVLAPGPNQPDLRYRPQAQLRPQGQVQMVAIGDDPPGEIAALGAAVPALYGPLAPLPPLPLSPAAVATADPTPWDWVSLSAPVARGLDSGALTTLRTHLGQGGGVLVAMDVAQTGLAALYPLVMELQQAIAAARREEAPADLQASLQQELAAVRGNIAGQVATLLQALQGFAMAVGCPLQGSGDIPADHPLRRHPFSFSRWPDLGDQPLQVRAWGGLVVVLGALPAAWGADPALDLPREQVRNAQELGVNLLHYGWYRRHLHRLQGTPAEKSSKGSDSLRDRLSEGGL